MNRQPLHHYEFGPFRLNATERLLYRDDDVVPLTPKVIDTLVLLIENCGHVVTKDGLMETLWPDSFVEESSLTQNISLLRKALAENGSKQHYIETIPKRGYRFVADVRHVMPADTKIVIQERISPDITIEEEQNLHDSRKPQMLARSSIDSQVRIRRNLTGRTFLIILGCVLGISAGSFYWLQQSGPATKAIAPKSIAVLPFKLIGAQPENQLIGLGMADIIILKLGRLRETTVLPTSSVFKYAKRDTDAVWIGNDLGVDAVLDGTVQIDGDRVRVTAQLIRVSDATILWSDKFDESYSGAFPLQDSVSERLTAKLQSMIGMSNTTNVSTRMTENADAYHAYLKGLYFWNRRNKENLSKAMDYLEQAVRIDPHFALAHALLADCYYLGNEEAYEILGAEESLTLADAAATKALELDNTVAEAHLVKAGVLFGRSNYGEADQEFRRALELKPNYAVAHLRYGYFLFAMKQLDDATVQMKQAQQLDPVSPSSNASLGFILFMTRDFDGSIKYSQLALELQPDVVAPRVNLGLAYIQKRMFREAFAEFQKLENYDSKMASEGKIKAYGLSGQRSEAARLLSKLHGFKNCESTSVARIAALEPILLYSSVGDIDMAFECLAKIQIKRFFAARLQFDPEFDPMRKDERFERYLKGSN